MRKMITRSLLTVLLLLLNNNYIVESITQDMSLYGKFNSYLVPIDQKELGEIHSKCFAGLDLTYCRPLLPTDDQVMSEELPYYTTLASLSGSPYCLQCCGRTSNNIDVWDLSCPLDFVTKTTTNVYGYELRVSTNRYAGDKGYVKCPLKRSACKYDSNGNTLGCQRLTDHTYLVGYELTLIVNQYDNNFGFWRGVSSCEIVSHESDTAPILNQMFVEKITMVHNPTPQPMDGGKALVLLVLIVFGVYFVLYFCRRKHCIICQKKLVCNMERCYLCVFFGAEPPDPVLLAALEDKGVHLQGVPPERFPGSTLFLAAARGYWARAIVRYSRISITHGQANAKEVAVVQSPKKNKKPKKPNPHLLPYPKHVLYAAISHPDPPACPEEDAAPLTNNPAHTNNNIVDSRQNDEINKNNKKPDILVINH